MPEEDVTPKKPANEVDNIRKILFGDQVAQFEERFISIEKSIVQLRTENRNLRQVLEEELTQREKAITNLTNLLEAALKERDEFRNQNLAAQSELMKALQIALEQYKSRAVPPPSQKK
jgi:hypothetical protein